MKATTLLSIGALIASCTIATAQAPERPERPERQNRQPRQVPPAMLKEFDKDGDGKLSEDERTAMRTAMQARAEEQRKALLAKYDADGDGKLGPEEAAKARADRQKEMLEKFDEDKDGKLSPEELRKARAAGFGMGLPGAPGGARGELV